MEVNGIFYQWYPKFSDKDIGTETSDKFVDTMQMSNLYLAGLGADQHSISIA